MSNKSLAFRGNEEDISKGIIPDKYRRIIPYIRGNTVLEVVINKLRFIMISTEKCKRILNDPNLSDEEIKKIRDNLYQLAEIQIDSYLNKKGVDDVRQREQ